MARHVYRNGVTIDFQAAIVVAANGGGAGSVIGDTTTTMMWISGIGALQLAPAFIGAIAAFAFFAPLTTLQQQRRPGWLSQIFFRKAHLSSNGCVMAGQSRSPI